MFEISQCSSSKTFSLVLANPRGKGINFSCRIFKAYNMRLIMEFAVIISSLEPLERELQYLRKS